MQVGIKLGVGAAAVALAGGALSVGAVAGASEPPPNPGQNESVPAQPQAPQEEEGHGPGAIFVGPEGAAKAMERLKHRNAQRAKWCNGRVLPANGLNVRTGPGTENHVVYALGHGARVTTNWSRIVREDGYLWVPLRNGRWLADYKLGNGNGKWYVKYYNC